MKITTTHLRTMIQEELRHVIIESDDDYLNWAESEDVTASIDVYYKSCREAIRRLGDDLETSIGAKDDWIKRCLTAVKRSVLESPEKTVF